MAPGGTRKLSSAARTVAGETVMRDWFDSLDEFSAKAVLVLGPDPFADRDSRSVVALHPLDFGSTAGALARSDAFGAQWRLNGGSLVAWKNLVANPHEDQAWITECLTRGVLSIVRTEIPMPLGHGFECFVFLGRRFTDKKEPSELVWSAMSVWPLIKEEIIAPNLDISPRERQVLMVLAEGLTIKDAGKRLGCAERTVTFHLTGLMYKLKADNRAAAITRACSLGLI